MQLIVVNDELQVRETSERVRGRRVTPSPSSRANRRRFAWASATSLVSLPARSRSATELARERSAARSAAAMNDLLDLDLSTPAASSSAQAGKGPQAGYGAGKSAFDYLSQMRTTTPSPVPSRSASPYSSTAATSSSTATSNGRLAPSAPTGRPAPPAKATSGAGDDAFSSLFGASPSSSSTTAGGLSMAERLARESAAKIGGVGAAAGGTWSTLSPTSTGGSGSRSS